MKKLLDLIRSSCKGQIQPLNEICKIFNKKTQDGKSMKFCSDLLDQSIRSMIDVSSEKDLDSLFTPGETTALTNQINGLDDFELIAFIVIQD